MFSVGLYLKKRQECLYCQHYQEYCVMNWDDRTGASLLVGNLDNIFYFILNSRIGLQLAKEVELSLSLQIRVI